MEEVEQYESYIEELKKGLGVEVIAPSANEYFIKFFRVHWWNGVMVAAPNEKDNLSKSNMTYVTAYAFFCTCRDLHAVCKFETEGKHDGIFTNVNGDVFLCAEWEWNCESVFGDKGELNKLLKSVEKHKYSDAMLLTYTLEDGYVDFAKRVAKEWMNSKTDATLILFIVVMTKLGNSQNSLNAVRILSINTKGCFLWDNF